MKCTEGLGRKGESTENFARKGAKVNLGTSRRWWRGKKVPRAIRCVGVVGNANDRKKMINQESSVWLGRKIIVNSITGEMRRGERGS